MILITSCVSKDGMEKNHLFLENRALVNINECIQLELINFDSQAVEFQVINKTNNRIIANGNPEIGIYFFDENLNEWVSVENNVMNVLTSSENLTTLEPNFGRYDFPANIEFFRTPQG